MRALGAIKIYRVKVSVPRRLAYGTAWKSDDSLPFRWGAVDIIPLKWRKIQFIECENSLAAADKSHCATGKPIKNILFLAHISFCHRNRSRGLLNRF